MINDTITFLETKMNEVRGTSAYNFKKKRSFNDRYNESTRIREKYPDKVPLIVCRANQCKTVPDIDRHKYLVPSDLTIGQFMYVIRKRIKLEPHVSIYMMIDGLTMPASCQLIGSLYNEYVDNDGFLYIIYTGESTFG